MKKTLKGHLFVFLNFCVCRDFNNGIYDTEVLRQDILKRPKKFLNDFLKCQKGLGTFRKGPEMVLKRSKRGPKKVQKRSRKGPGKVQKSLEKVQKRFRKSLEKVQEKSRKGPEKVQEKSRKGSEKA